MIKLTFAEIKEVCNCHGLPTIWQRDDIHIDRYCQVDLRVLDTKNSNPLKGDYCSKEDYIKELKG